MPGRNVEHDEQIDEGDVTRLHELIDQRYDQRRQSDPDEGFEISLGIAPHIGAQGVRPKRLREQIEALVHPSYHWRKSLQYGIHLSTRCSGIRRRMRDTRG